MMLAGLRLLRVRLLERRLAALDEINDRKRERRRQGPEEKAHVQALQQHDTERERTIQNVKPGRPFI